MKKPKLELNKIARSIRRSYLNTRAKARFIGFFYLVATVLVAALACLPMVSPSYKGSPVELGVAGFWNIFKYTGAEGQVLKFKEVMDAVKAGSIELLGLNHVMGILYAVMLVFVVVNVIKAICQLSSLFNDKIDKEALETLNDNVTAMQKLGNIFSNSVASLIIFNFFIACLGDKMPLKDLVNVQLVAGVPNIVLALGVTLVLHLILGVAGSKVSLFGVEEMESEDGYVTRALSEQRNTISAATPFARNLLQLCAVVGLMVCFIQAHTLQFPAELFASKTVIENYVALISSDAMGFVSVVLQLVAMFSLVVLVKHATATTEYNLEGAKGAGGSARFVGN